MVASTSGCIVLLLTDTIVRIIIAVRVAIIASFDDVVILLARFVSAIYALKILVLLTVRIDIAFNPVIPRIIHVIISQVTLLMVELGRRVGEDLLAFLLSAASIGILLCFCASVG